MPNANQRRTNEKRYTPFSGTPRCAKKIHRGFKVRSQYTSLALSVREGKRRVEPPLYGGLVVEYSLRIDNNLLIAS